MKQILTSAGLELRLWLSVVWARTRPAWLLLGLVCICLVSSPVTQHLWAWDGFLRGGQDFETGTLLILISCCLLVVLLQTCKAALKRILAALRGLDLLFHDFQNSGFSPVAGSPAHSGALFRPTVSLPLQV